MPFNRFQVLPFLRVNDAIGHGTIFSFFFPLLFTLIVLPACNGNRQPRVIDRSFYYWKSSLTLGTTEKKVLTDLHVKRLYVKFFDVAWNQASLRPMPQAVIKLPGDQAMIPVRVIPVVFITNECIYKMNASQVQELAANILLLIKRLSMALGVNTPEEIQIDCDWTATTKDKYFRLLEIIRKETGSKKILLSATIRLYQYKYHGKSGVPPVDRGLLMCYNMGNLQNPDTRNSILDPEELKKYMNGLTAYPLPLDVALPVFSWKVLFRNHKFAGLIHALPAGLLKNSPLIKQSGNIFRVTEPCSISGYSFNAGDLIRDEEVTYKALISAESILTEKLNTRNLTIILYHLDSLTLSKFSIHELETVFDNLH